MIRCSHCNAENSMDRILCISCGKELDFSSPDLFINTEELKAEQIKEKPSAAKIKMHNTGFFSSLVKFISFSLVFTLAFLIFSTSHIPIVSINEKIKNNALKKIKTISKSNTPDHYVTFNSDELSSLINDIFCQKIDIISEKYPDFFTPAALTAQIYDHSMEIFLEFSFLSRPLIISLKGSPLINNKEPNLKTTGARLGRIPIPVFIAAKLFLPLKDIFQNTKILPEKIISAEIDKGNLSIYKSKILQTTDKDNSSFIHNPVPEDILLIQAADNFLMRKKFELAKRYYRICLARYPKSPLKNYVKEQIKSIGNQ